MLGPFRIIVEKGIFCIAQVGMEPVVPAVETVFGVKEPEEDPEEGFEVVIDGVDGFVVLKDGKGHERLCASPSVLRILAGSGKRRVDSVVEIDEEATSRGWVV